MPKVFSKNSKITVIEYGGDGKDDFEFIKNIKNKIIGLSKKLLAA